MCMDKKLTTIPNNQNITKNTFRKDIIKIMKINIVIAVLYFIGPTLSSLIPCSGDFCHIVGIYLFPKF